MLYRGKMLSQALFGIFLISLSYLLFVTPVTAEEHVVSVGHEKFNFDPGDGNCRLDPKQSQIDKALLEWQKNAQQGQNELLAMFAPCDALQNLRSGQNEELPSWSILLATLQDKKLNKIYGYSRAQFLNEITKGLANGIKLDSTEISKRLNDTLPKEIARDIGKLEMSGVKQLGVLHRDEAAIYTGLLMGVSTQQKKTTVAAIISISLTKGYMVTFNNYREFIDQSTFKRLISEAKSSMQGFIKE